MQSVCRAAEFETRDMAVKLEADCGTRAFRQALGQFPTGVCVVTCTVDGVTLGITVSSFNSVSLDPPLVLFSIDKCTASLPFWERASEYAVNVLAENQQDISERFAKRSLKKWEGLNYTVSSFGAPLLPGVAAVFECAAEARHAAGDHALFIGRVKNFRAFAERRPLVFSKGRYSELRQTEEDAFSVANPPAS
jgi:flavin reductase (DIM6/NTAB) family NADH-FMN oxidoreductase RutF